MTGTLLETQQATAGLRPGTVNPRNESEESYHYVPIGRQSCLRMMALHNQRTHRHRKQRCHAGVLDLKTPDELHSDARGSQMIAILDGYEKVWHLRQMRQMPNQSFPGQQHL
jgi:hypothetical protein